MPSESAALTGKAKGVHVTCRIDKSCTILIDRDRILQAISNLVDNALRHTAAGGYVEIGSDSRTTSVEIWVLNSSEHIQPMRWINSFSNTDAGSARCGWDSA